MAGNQLALPNNPGQLLARVAGVTGNWIIARQAIQAIQDYSRARQLTRYIGDGAPRPRQPRRQREMMRRDIKDHGYQQFAQFKFKSGKKRSADSKRRSILQTIIANYRLRFSRLLPAGLGEGKGAYFLTHSVVNDTVDDLPLMAINLTSVRQGNVSAAPGRRLQMSTNPSFTGLLQWAALPGQSITNTGSTVDNVEWQYEDNEGGLTAVGRKSWLDWVRIRLTLWGKQNAPAKYVVRLVKFSDAEYCPESYALGIGMDGNANSFYQALIKPLDRKSVA